MQLPTVLSAPVAALIVKVFMRDAMNLCLSILKSDLEKAPRS